MQITPVDQEQNLFRITNVFPQHIVDLVNQTDWINLDWARQEGQENWRRRRINHSAISWIDQWHNHFRSIWPAIERELGVPIHGYTDTAFWIDEPGFTCAMHTDGEMPGAMQMTWIGDINLGTSFYHYKNSNSLRHQFVVNPNTGYIMINRLQPEGYRKLQWHAMLNPVPTTQFRISSYSWITTR
jgi:hypothetical protein